MTIEESKMMWKLEVENNKPLYSSFSKEMKRLYNKVDELINEGVITYEDFTNDVIDSITTTIVDNGKSNAEPSRADQVNAMQPSLVTPFLQQVFFHFEVLLVLKLCNTCLMIIIEEGK